MTGLKTFRLVPFCLLLLAGNVFAAGNGASGDEISNYAKVLNITIENTGGSVFDNYKGKQCLVIMHLARDGSLLGSNIEGGSTDLCEKLLDVMHNIKKFPAPPSDLVYRKFKDVHLAFTP